MMRNMFEYYAMPEQRDMPPGMERKPFCDTNFRCSAAIMGMGRCFENVDTTDEICDRGSCQAQRCAFVGLCSENFHDVAIMGLSNNATTMAEIAWTFNHIREGLM